MRGVSRRSLLGGAALSLLGGAGLYRLLGRRSEGLPNILLITADDLGLQLGCHGDPVAQTPHIDRFASGAVQFENAYITHGSCSPSRASLLTGLYSHQHGLDGLAHTGYALQPDLPTLFDLTREAGYRTALIGKNHVTGGMRGADRELVPGKLDEGKGVDRYAAECARLFEEWSVKPFFCMANYTDPHTPFRSQVNGFPEVPVTPDQVAPFPFQGIDTPALRKRIAGYYTNLKRFDAGVGLLLDALERSGHSNDTLVILTSDQGPPFARSKTTVYEAGLRVPLIVRWPGVSRPAHRSSALVSLVDLFPTFCEVTQWGAPDDALPGRSLVPLLGGAAVEWRDSLFAEYTAHTLYHFFPRRSVRDHRYKLIVNLLAPARGNPVRSMDGNRSWQASREPQFDGTLVREAFDRYAHPPAMELYDLKKDPYEFRNLAEEGGLEAVKADLLKKLEWWRRRTDDPYLDPRRLRADTAHHDRLMEEKAERYRPPGAPPPHPS